MTATRAGGTPGMEPPHPGDTESDSVSMGRPAPSGGSGHGSESLPPGQAGRIAELRDRLRSPMPDDGIWGWVWPLLITAVAAFTRFNRLAVPRALIFDETYYAKDAWSILVHGVEWNPVKNANALILAHQTTGLFKACQGTACGEYVVQPPFGKLAIAVGEWAGGLDPEGWRLASAVFGTLAIFLMCRVTRRLTRSTLLGCLGGLLLSLDGLEYVLSRTGILDIFLMFFVLAAFGCLLVDRDESRSRLASALVLTRSDDAGPGLGIRKWRIAAGVMLGLACASKQYAAWYIIAFALLAIFTDLGARRSAGLRRPLFGALARDGKWLPLTLGVIPLVVYTLTWTGWMATSTGYDRNYAALHGVRVPVVSALYSLFNYHQQMLQFGVGLSTRHPYMSQPWGWIVISRPVAFYYECYTSAAATRICPSGYSGPQWSQEVLAMGNPAIWWVSIPALIFCLGWWFMRRDWRAGAAVLAVAAGWATWLPFMSRTKFYYYALEFEPFLIMCIVLCAGLIIGSAARSRVRRSVGAAVAGAYTLAVLYLFWYFYPILAGKIIPYQDWLSHMWYHGWI